MAAAAGDSVKAMMVQDDGSPRACYEPGIGSVLVLSFGPGSELSCLTFHRSGRLVFLSVVGAVKQDGQVARLGPDQYRAPGQVDPVSQVHNRPDLAVVLGGKLPDWPYSAKVGRSAVG